MRLPEDDAEKRPCLIDSAMKLTEYGVQLPHPPRNERAPAPPKTRFSMESMLAFHGAWGAEAEVSAGHRFRGVTSADIRPSVRPTRTPHGSGKEET